MFVDTINLIPITRTLPKTKLVPAPIAPALDFLYALNSDQYRLPVTHEKWQELPSPPM